MNARNARNRRWKIPIQGIHIVQCLCCIILILDVVLLWTILFSSRGVLGYRRARLQTEELKAKIAALHETNREVFRKIKRFNENPKARERLAREQLGWAREDELVVEFVRPEERHTP